MPGKKRKRLFFREVDMMRSLHKSRLTIALYIVLRSIVILIMILSALDGRWENLFTCALALFLFVAPVLLEKHLRINLPTPLEIVILLFIFAAEILGELQEYYIRVAYWDTMLHTVNGFLCAAVGFALVDLLNKDRNIQFRLSPLYLAIAAFCFSMTIGVLWEFFEFGIDYLFHRDMQKDTILNAISTVKLDPVGGNTPVYIANITEMSINGQELGLGGYLDIGLYDTMKDLMVNFLGAVIFSVIGFFYVKNRGKGKLARSFIPKVMHEGESWALSESAPGFSRYRL